MRAFAGMYRTQLRVTWVTQMQYRAAMFIWLIGLVLEPVIYLVVWSTVARSSGGQVGGYGARDFAAYFLVLMIVNHLTFTWIFGEFEYRIREGILAPLLLRPVHPIHRDIADNLSYKLLTLVAVVPATIGLSLAFHPAFHPPPWAVGAFVPALALAYALRFTVEWTLALAAFWVTRVAAINQMYYVAVLFLSGQVAPLALFPRGVQVVATLLPFRWMVAFPTELLLGRLSPVQALIGFAAQAAWLLVALALLRVVWRAGVRQFSAVGA